MSLPDKMGEILLPPPPSLPCLGVEGWPTLTPTAVNLFIPTAAILSMFFAAFLWWRVSFIRTTPLNHLEPLDPAGDPTSPMLDGNENQDDDTTLLKAAEIQAAIEEGAKSFLDTEFRYMGLFVVCFSVFLFLALSSEDGFATSWDAATNHPPAFMNGIFTTLAFLLGAATSMLSGYLGMRIATYANARVALEARHSVGRAFMAAFRSGAVMGFILTGAGLLVLFATMALYHAIFRHNYVGVYEALTGYGLGGSTIALFGRVGGGIYTKAADVGADLVGKVEQNIPEDDPRNPATIADNVGDNVGDIAGMGADLFGSFAESTCAALVVASLSGLGEQHCWVAMQYPLLISAAGMLGCMLTTFIATDIRPARTLSQIEPTLKTQLLVSTLLLTPVVYWLSLVALPASFDLLSGYSVDGVPTVQVVKNWHLFCCVASGLWGGLIIGIQTEYYTSNTYRPTQEVADACRTGAATNIIFGLALGYQSAVLPTLVLGVAIFVGFALAGMLGIACAAIGMLTTLATGLAIDAYGPISDNAGGIAEMAELGEDVRERTDALDAAGNTTAAIGKGFAIGSAALVSLALFGAFVTRAGIQYQDASILDPKVFPGLLVGAMLPYWFSAMTMKSVGKAALAMVEEVREQFRTRPGILEGTQRPDYKRCVEISTRASLKEMVLPGVLVMGSPLLVGVLFGVHALAGLLAGALVSGVQMAVSMSNTGGAWDNGKKYIEAGATEAARALGPKGSDAHVAAVIGDTVGDPLKDTSGPALNILMKLMAVESLVFAPFLAAYCRNGLVFDLIGM